MANSYRPVERDQRFLLPPDMAEWLPQDHLVWFVLDVIDELDTAAFHRRHRNAGQGRAAYDPDMLLGLLLYAYAVGERSSRRIERLCHDHVAFRVLCAQDVPDHTTIARFRAVHQEAFAELFARVLRLCVQAGMGRVGVVSIDGTKVAANAALGANRSEESLRRKAQEILDEAAAVDAREDEELGPDRRGDELPAKLADRSGRKERIRRALEEIERQQDEAGAQDAADRRRIQEYQRRAEAGGPMPRGRRPAGLDLGRLHQAQLETAQQEWERAEPGSRERNRAASKRAAARRALRELEQAEATTSAQPVEMAAARKRRRHGRTAPQANLTDPDSRMMTDKTGGFLQGYNVQIAVSDDHLILATGISHSSSDATAFEPMLGAAVDATRDAGLAPIGTVLADAGYFSEHNLTIPGPDRLIAPGKHRDVARAAARRPTSEQPPPSATAREQMTHRMRDPEQYERYKRRSATVETVIAMLKDLTGLRRFSRRGTEAVTSELQLAAAVVNLRRLHTHLQPHRA